MKILLTQPLTSYIKEPPTIPDLGLGYISAHLKKHGHEVFVRDWNMEPREKDFCTWLAHNRPNVIGMKIFTKDVLAAKKTIIAVKEILPEILIVIGGPHPSCSDSKDLMDDFADADFAFRGEVEHSLPMFLSIIESTGGMQNRGLIPSDKARSIPGLVWREQGTVRANSVSLIDNLNNLELPDWENINPNAYSGGMIVPESKEGKTAPIITTRGCPGQCTFCSAYHVNGKNVRYRSPENVVREIFLLYDIYNVRRFMFMDNGFTSDKKNLIDICEGILEKGINIEWDFVSYERLNNLTCETLSLIYRAGGRMIHMGIESGSEKIRKVINKTCSLIEISEKVRIIRNNNIKVGAWFMIGFPEETKNDMDETVKYAFSLGTDLVTFTICFPLPGSQVYHYIKSRYNFKTIDWASFNIENSIYPVSQLSSKELRSILNIIRFKLLIGRIFKMYIKKIKGI